MRRLPTLPRVFGRFAEIGGVIDFAIFEDADGDLDEAVAAIVEALGGKAAGAADGEALRKLGARSLDEAAFFGAWYDAARGTLKDKDWQAAVWEEVRRTQPTVSVHTVSPEDCRRILGIEKLGHFASAFANPPYGLWARPDEVQAIFAEVRNIILPPGSRAAILDWSSERLVEVSDYFEDGLEWWGVYLFSIHLPETRRLTVAMASATD